MEPRGDTSYCSIPECPKARECIRHKSHYTFPERSNFRWVDYAYCVENGYALFAPKKERNDHEEG